MLSFYIRYENKLVFLNFMIDQQTKYKLVKDNLLTNNTIKNQFDDDALQLLLNQLKYLNLGYIMTIMVNIRNINYIKNALFLYKYIAAKLISFHKHFDL